MDTVVLACTHFPLVADRLAAAAPRLLRFVDGAEGIARRVAFLTSGQDWPAAPAGIAVLTRADAPLATALAPAFERRGLARVELL